MTEDKQMAQLISKVHEVWNSPKNKANHKHWLVYSYLELDELISLSYDREPTHWTDTFDALEKYSDIARDFCHRRELIRRAIKVGDLQEPVRPKAFTKWVKENKLFDLSEQFCNAAERKKKPDDELGARERDSLFTILACLAYHHGFDPRKQRNDATQKIIRIIEKYGYDVSNDTLLKWLRIACEDHPIEPQD